MTDVLLKSNGDSYPESCLSPRASLGHIKASRFQAPQVRETVMEDGKYLYGRFEDVCVIKPIGHITFRASSHLDSLINRLQNDEAVQGYIIDLTETRYIDSTNLGLLAKVQDLSMRRLSKPPTVISNSPSINETLVGLGFDRIFDIVSHGAFLHDTGFSEEHDCSGRPLAQILLNAHRYLASLSDHNADMFRDVIAFLEKDSTAFGS
jgi:anti-anti-sigma factor